MSEMVDTGNGRYNPLTGEGWSAIVNDSGEAIRVGIDRISGSKIYDVQRIPPASAGEVPRMMLQDQTTKVIHGLHEFSDLELSEESLWAIEQTAQSAINHNLPAAEQLLYEANIKFGLPANEAAIRAKAQASGITDAQAKSVVDKYSGTHNAQPSKPWRNPDTGELYIYETTNPINPAEEYSKPEKSTEDFRVRLISKNTGDQVTFYVSPNIDESRSASYDAVTPIHHPGAIQIYKTTNARNFNINGKLISRNEEEATINLAYVNLIRSWVMPYYGEGTAEHSYTKKSLGAPPDVLTLTAYGEQNLKNVPVVLTSYSWTYPDNVDYIPTKTGVPFPAIIETSLMMMETFSPEEFSKFNLSAYKLGLLDEAFNGSAEYNIPTPSEWVKRLKR